MYKAPTGPLGTLHQVLRKDLQNIPTPDPTPDTAKRMAQMLQEIAEAMHAAEEPYRYDRQLTGHGDPHSYWRRFS